MELIYHYTTEHHLEMIKSKGELIVSETERKYKIKPPALWLSLNPVWENTATKTINENGIIRRLTKEEQYENLGLIRFVLEFKKESLCTWARYKYKSNLPSRLYEEMELAGIEQGADPKEWFASFKNIPLSKCISCEKWDGNEWKTLINYRN
jgi:hypothetical protein